MSVCVCVCVCVCVSVCLCVCVCVTGVCTIILYPHLRQMSTECVTFEHSVSKRQLLVTDLETDLRPVELPEDALSYDVFSTAMLQELDCMEELSSLLWNVPQEMCFLSKHHIASIGNEQCWTGTDMGRYVCVCVF